MSKTVTVETRWDGTMPRLLDPRRYRHETKKANWRVGDILHMRLSRPTRSDRANAYYWSTVLGTIERDSESGNTLEQLHDAFCEMFIPSEARKVEFFSKMTGETLTTSIDHRRSSALSGGAFYDFVEKVRAFAEEFWPGLDIPDPDPEYWRKPKRTRKKVEAA